MMLVNRITIRRNDFKKYNQKHTSNEKAKSSFSVISNFKLFAH